MPALITEGIYSPSVCLPDMHCCTVLSSALQDSGAHPYPLLDCELLESESSLSLASYNYA